MLKKLKIKHLESHEDTEITFSNGLNLLVGESNSGKTSIIRSIDLVCSNEFSKEMVRNGYSFCEVYLETENGWVECKRGENINEWRCCDGNELHEYRAVGVGVPEEVPKILGLGKRELCGIKEKPNFMFQLEKHYMLSEVDGKKATSNLVARLMDNAIGLGGMEDLIKNLASDLSKCKKELNEKQSTISSLKDEIIDKSIYDRQKNLVLSCRSLYDEIDLIIKNCNIVESKLKEYNDLKIVVEKLESVDINSFNVEECITLIKEIEFFEHIYKSWKEADFIIETQKTCDIDLDNLVRLYDEIAFKENQLFDMESRQIKYSDYDILVSALESCEKDFIDDIEQAEKDFIYFKNKIGICPLCGEKLSGEKHEK